MELFEKLDKALKNLYSVFKKASSKVSKIARRNFIGAPEGPPPYFWRKSIAIGGKDYFLMVEDEGYMNASVIRITTPKEITLSVCPQSDKDFVYYVRSFTGDGRTRISNSISDSFELKDELGINEQEIEELINQIKLWAIERM